uniref:Secreted protein n=1 Tax=Ditylenchus dipsaci TaxID=166011 RepID=A0A915EA83_9BILA
MNVSVLLLVQLVVILLQIISVFFRLCACCLSPCANDDSGRNASLLRLLIFASKGIQIVQHYKQKALAISCSIRFGCKWLALWSDLTSSCENSALLCRLQQAKANVDYTEFLRRDVSASS